MLFDGILIYTGRTEGLCPTIDGNVLADVGAYTAAMDGVDAIVFTAGVGENDKRTRKDICSALTFLGIKIDDTANDKRGEEVVISTPDSKVKVMVIPTNEELKIAQETLELVR